MLPLSILEFKMGSKRMEHVRKIHHKKVQIIQSKWLKSLLNCDRRTPTDLVHYHLTLLKINNMHTAKILSFLWGWGWGWGGWGYVHEFMSPVRCTVGQPISTALLDASKMSLRLLWVTLVTTNRIYSAYQFTDVVSLYMYDAHWFPLGIKLLLLLLVKTICGL